MASKFACGYAYIATPTTPFGLVSDGSISDTIAPIHNEGLGGLDIMTAGILVPTISIGYSPYSPVIPAAGLLATSGFPCSEPGAYTIGVGLDSIEYRLVGGRCNSMELSCTKGDTLKCSMEFMGTSFSETTYSLPDQSGTVIEPFNWSQVSSILLTGTNYDFNSFSVSVSTNLEVLTTLGGNGTIFPDALTSTKQTVSLTVETNTRIPASVRGNLAANLVKNHTFAVTFNNGINTFTISMAGLAFSSGGVPINKEGTITYSYQLEAHTNSATAIELA